MHISKRTSYCKINYPYLTHSSSYADYLHSLPGHEDIAGNEKSDKLVEQATTLLPAPNTIVTPNRCENLLQIPFTSRMEKKLRKCFIYKLLQEHETIYRILDNGVSNCSRTRSLSMPLYE